MRGLAACQLLPGWWGIKFRWQLLWNGRFGAEAAVEYDQIYRRGERRGPELPSKFPHVVKFEQGATRFQNGDKITILEVRGTADTMSPGNNYRIKGTYTLASHDRATLAAYTTASKAANGTGPTHKVQSTMVNPGTGTFTLVLPMSCEGWPHLSYYPTDGGSDFGGNYFGTGDTVLKKWWGEH